MDTNAVFQRRLDRERAWLIRFYSGKLPNFTEGKHALYTERILSERLERVPAFDGCDTHRIACLYRKSKRPIGVLLFGLEYDFRLDCKADEAAIAATEYLYGSILAAPIVALTPNPDATLYWAKTIDRVLNSIVGEFKLKNSY